MQFMIRSYLERSDAGWLLFVGDGAFIDVSELKALKTSIQSQNPIDNPAISGQCSQIRDYFETFAKNSGAFISRRAAVLLNETVQTWAVACEVEIDGSEALSHALDITGQYAAPNDNHRFLGYPFRAKSDYVALLTKNFAAIENCPKTYSSNRVCHPIVVRMKDVVIWAGAGPEMSKIEFLENARTMLAGLPDNLYFKYTVYEAELCLNNEPV
jgi:hypothetical protein